jgi:HlyD family secretion protein
MKRFLRAPAIAIVLVFLAAAAGVFWRWQMQQGHKPMFRTVAVKRGDLTATISATGTVEPEEVVDVGAQVAGIINVFGKDKNGKTIDYGSVVEEGMMLAKIDDVLYRADMEVARAQVDQDKAAELHAAADLQQMTAKEAEAEADWNRAQKLGPSEALAPTTYDSYKANYEIAKANVALDEAALVQARATTVAAQATLDKAQRTLDYCTISSPVKGVIVDRRVTIGETVVSSFNTPSLFLIAKDLTRIQVWVSVNEADIGSIHPGQPATFTVDAYPDQVFHGKVGKIRLNATMTQNVVTYTVEVNTDNADGRLLPYLTANVEFLTGERHDVLLVPNAALRWRPQPDQIDPLSRQRAEGPALAADARSRSEKKAAAKQTGILWVDEGDLVRSVTVTLGLSDGVQTEVQGQDLSDGAPVVIAVQSVESAAEEQATNPFAPKPWWNRRPSNPGRTNRVGRTNS